MKFRPGRSVPACYIELEWTNEGQQRELFREVRIIGVKRPRDFVMRYYPQTAGMSFSCVVDNSH